MSSLTVVMMLLILGLNWGGFAFCLWYGARRSGRSAE
jgi:hypothetical protein